MDNILKQYEKLYMDKVQSNTKHKRREETYINKHSDIQISDTQGHTINIVPNNRELTENSEQTVIDIWTNKMVTSTL